MFSIITEKDFKKIEFIYSVESKPKRLLHKTRLTGIFRIYMTNPQFKITCL